MLNFCKLSGQSLRYLQCFYAILDEMIDAMTTAGLTQSISHNFIVQMIPHHRAAIKMSENILQYSQNEQVRKIASNIVSMQTKSIADMQKILPTCSMQYNTTLQLELYQRRMELILHTMFSDMGSAPENNQLSIVFMQEMIPHHEGAICMAENTLKYEICPGLVPILCEIISSQRTGVLEMQALLRRMGVCK